MSEANGGQQGNHQIMLIVALMSLLGVVVTGLFAYYSGERAATHEIIKATATAETIAKLTPAPDPNSDAESRAEDRVPTLTITPTVTRAENGTEEDLEKYFPANPSTATDTTNDSVPTVVVVNSTPTTMANVPTEIAITEPATRQPLALATSLVLPTNIPDSVVKRELPAGIKDQVSSVQVSNGCVDIFGSQDSDNDVLTVCESISRLEDKWSDHTKKVALDCTNYPGLEVELWIDDNYTGGSWNPGQCPN